MNANQLVNSLTFAEVDSQLEPDTRRMMQQERFALQAEIRSGNAKRISSAMEEAKRVAEMWGVTI